MATEMFAVVLVAYADNPPGVYHVITGFRSRAKAQAFALDYVNRRKSAFVKSLRIVPHVVRAIDGNGSGDT